MNEAFHITPNPELTRIQSAEGLQDYSDLQMDNFISEIEGIFNAPSKYRFLQDMQEKTGGNCWNKFKHLSAETQQEIVDTLLEEAEFIYNSDEKSYIGFDIWQFILEHLNSFSAIDKTSVAQKIIKYSTYDYDIESAYLSNKDVDWSKIAGTLLSDNDMDAPALTLLNLLPLRDVLSNLERLETFRKEYFFKFYHPTDFTDLLFDTDPSIQIFLQTLLEHDNRSLRFGLSNQLKGPIHSENLISAIEKSIEQGKDGAGEYLEFLADIPESLALKILYTPKNRDLLVQYASNFISFPKEAEEILGFNLEKLLNSWKAIGTTERPLTDVVHRNADAVLLLEKRQKGSVKLLMENFGICDFERYPPSILLRQLEFQKQSLDYGVVFFPKADHNDAFNQYQYGFLKSLFRENTGVEMIIVEVGTTRELAKQLVSLSYKFGPMSYLIVGGHGNGEKVSLGGRNYPGNSSRSHSELTGIDVIKLRNDKERQDSILKPGAPILFHSCSAGKVDGIAQQTARNTTTVVTGPDNPSVLVWINIQRTETGQLIIKPNYIPNQTKAMVYSGEK